jgi:hypothetical protein
MYGLTFSEEERAGFEKLKATAPAEISSAVVTMFEARRRVAEVHAQYPSNSTSDQAKTHAVLDELHTSAAFDKIASYALDTCGIWLGRNEGTLREYLDANVKSAPSTCPSTRTGLRWAPMR